MDAEITIAQAKTNLAHNFRKNSHLRDPKIVDQYVNNYYALMHDAEAKYSDVLHFLPYILRKSENTLTTGYSYLDQKRFANKSDFLKSFYKGSRPNL